MTFQIGYFRVKNCYSASILREFLVVEIATREIKIFI